MKTLLTVTAIAAAALLTGCGAAAQASQPAAVVKPHKLQTAAPLIDEGTPATSIEEDEPGWDCLTMGTRTCGANPIERTEAWGHFRAADLPTDIQGRAFRVTYYGLALPGVDFPPSEYVTYTAQLTTNRVHVFRVEAVPGE